MRYIKAFYRFLRDIYNSRRLLIDLVKNDFKSRYLSNYLGVLWAFVQPTVLMLIFWFVFEVGFKTPPIQNTPFVLWLISGLIPWFFFAEALGSATNAILDSSFLVKKIVFRVSLLPVIKIISALVIHSFFVVFMLGIFVFYNYYPSLFWFQLIYYIFATIVLLLGLTWITSSIIVFFRDLGQLVSMGIQIGFWITPIFWMLSILPAEYLDLFKLNPMYYITQGYRETLIDQIWFWEKPVETLQFWSITLVVFILGAIVFRKLRPHFADVL